MTRRYHGETVIIRGPAFGLPETDPVVGRIMGDESEREPVCAPTAPRVAQSSGGQ